MSRDYAAEMRAVIDAETSHGPYVSRIIAREIVEKLEANDPELLTGWLTAQAEQLIWSAINERDRSRRSYARASESRSAFAEAAAEDEAVRVAALESGTTPDAAERAARLGRWLGCRFVVEDGSRRALATLTRADLLFVAERYDDRSRRNSFEAAFMRALSKKVRNGTVADHLTEEQIAALRQSLS